MRRRWTGWAPWAVAVAVAVWAAVGGGGAHAPAGGEKKLLAARKASLAQVVRAGGGRRPQVVLLGTFHFQDAGLDEYKPKAVFDPLARPGRKQVAEVLDRLAQFAPTKVVVEYPASAQDKLDELFRRYQEGKAKPSRNEIVQIGFALAHRLKHPRVYGFDAPMNQAIPAPDVAAAAKRLGQEQLTDPKEVRCYYAAFARIDQMKTELTLRQTLRVMNDPEVVRLLNGVYFNGAHRVADGKEYPGPDGFLTRWYNRNLRMFANLRRVASAPADRVLVVVGAGHLAILRHCVTLCPELELVETDRLLGET